MLPTVWYSVSAQPRLPIIPMPGLLLSAMLRLKYSLKLTPTPGFHQSCYSFGLCMTANPESGCLEAHMVLGTVALWRTLIGVGLAVTIEQTMTVIIIVLDSELRNLALLLQVKNRVPQRLCVAPASSCKGSPGCRCSQSVLWTSLQPICYSWNMKRDAAVIKPFEELWPETFILVLVSRVQSSGMLTTTSGSLITRRKQNKPRTERKGMAGRGTLACHLSTQEANAEGLRVKGQHGLSQETLSVKKEGYARKVNED